MNAAHDEQNVDSTDTETDKKRLIDLRELPGSEQSHVVRGEGKFPRFAQFDDGAVFVATHRGTHQPGRDNSLQGFVSNDGGRTWSEPREMLHNPGIDPRSPAVGVGANETLYAGWSERKWDDPSNSRVAFYRSENRGQDWSFVSEIEIPDHDRVGHPYGKLLIEDDHIFILVDDGDTLLIAWYVNNEESENLEHDRQCRTLRVDRNRLL